MNSEFHPSEALAGLIGDALMKADTVLVVDLGPNDDESWNRFVEAGKAVLAALDKAAYEIRRKSPASGTGTSNYTEHVDAA